MEKIRKKFLKPKIKRYIEELTVDCYDDNMLLLGKVCNMLELEIFESDFDDDNVSELLMKDENSDTYSIYVNRKHPDS